MSNKLIWWRDTHVVSAGEAGARLSRYFTPDGIISQPISTPMGQCSRYQLWIVHQFRVFLIAAGSAAVKPGTLGKLLIASDQPAFPLGLTTKSDGLMERNWGLVYDGPPFVATHGIGWAFEGAAVASGDAIWSAFLYEVPG